MVSNGSSRPNLDLVRAEIEDLRTRVAAGGYGKLAFFLMCARIVAERQSRHDRDGAPEEEAGERWELIES